MEDDGPNARDNQELLFNDVSTTREEGESMKYLNLRNYLQDAKLKIALPLYALQLSYNEVTL